MERPNIVHDIDHVINAIQFLISDAGCRDVKFITVIFSDKSYLVEVVHPPIGSLHVGDCDDLLNI